MALIAADGFGTYTTVADRWVVNTGVVAIASGSGRWGSGSNCIRLTGASTPANCHFVLPATYTEVFLTFAFKGSATNGSSGSTFYMLAVYEGSTQHITLGIDASGRVNVTRAGTSLGTGTTLGLNSGTWHSCEMRIVLNDTTGVVVVKVDGTTEINLSSQDTRNGGSGFIDRVRFSVPTNAAASWDYADFAAADTTGSSPTNTYLGDVRIEALFPNGNGNSSVLVGSDGNSTDNYLLVDETNPNGDTDYVESSSVGDKDTYAYPSITATSGTVYGVQVLPWARKTDAGVRSIVSVARLSGTEVDSAAKALGASYAYLPDIRETKPGGGAWSVSDVNAAEFGVKVNA